MKRLAIVLVTGSCGLVGSEVSRFFGSRGFQVQSLEYILDEIAASWMERLAQKATS
jgi:hypothetical protein